MSGRRGQRSAPAAPEGARRRSRARCRAYSPASVQIPAVPPPGESQRFGQAARFIQFDIDHLIAPAQPRQALPGVAALVGANRQRMNEVFQRRVVVGGERLLKHRHTEVRQQLTARRQPLAVRDSKLASTISVASGAAWRIAISRSLISRSSSFTFNSWAPACHSAAALAAI